MNNDSAKQLVLSVFEAIGKARNVEELQNVFRQHKVLKSAKINENIYPDLAITITPDEIEQIRAEGKISTDNTIIPSELNSLEKLLYSILWKNRDTKKEAHVIGGILSTKKSNNRESNTEALVFFQFGKHLADANEPIVDQHTLRACQLYSVATTADDETITKIRRSVKFSVKDINLLCNYFNGLEIKTPEFKKEVDKVLYALGKAIKKKQKRLRTHNNAIH